MNVLVIGSGAREHALCVALLRDAAVQQVWCAPGNAGTGRDVGNVDVDPASGDAVAALAADLGADLVVVGPEAPLVAGVADAVRARGIACFGPSAAAAQLEGSKAFAKDVMAAAGVPTAQARVCTTPEETAAALDTFGAPYVVKDDALAAGKGVLVTPDRDAALAHAATCGRVLVEEFLDGPEVSLFVVTDGTTALPLLPSQDFKRVGDGDDGPNTGGMGAYAPLGWIPEGVVDDVMASVVGPTLQEMARRGAPFAGLLYVGLALTAAGPQVVEFNVRFGDPETEVVLPLLETALGDLLLLAATGRLADQEPLQWRDGSACTVVVAAAGYPGQVRSGDRIDGLDEAAEVDGVTVLHAGTRADGDTVLSAGGRVLAVTAVGDTLDDARDRAYRAVSLIHLDGAHHRHDIAAWAAQMDRSYGFTDLR